jgi:hypothetical protein
VFSRRRETMQRAPNLQRNMHNLLSDIMVVAQNENAMSGL